ncbi:MULTISPECIES: BtpA/SgcQ family protein [unclassified Bradyrhizobium]|uniref:BtpA/SgcQ family protein n=1 Tax=unclassified Bradyrhizobium TaxID=2631580 RepID=UPI002916BA91|nr:MULTISPECIES: BtpA/SgcQ family protein [unclassified Bradyrhizobium]
MDFKKKPVIACIHLLPTPGSPQYGGSIDRIYEAATRDAKIFSDCGVDALIVENFRDGPFFPSHVPVETSATLAGVTREVILGSRIPVGVAVLRNDAEAAIAIAVATGAAFVRVNVHIGAALSPQGILEGNSHRTLRLRSALRSDVMIFADAGVKHSSPWTYPDLADEIRDLSTCSEAIIVSGPLTAIETEVRDLALAKRTSRKPVLVGSGITPDNLEKVFPLADGFIIGSYFKTDGVPLNTVDPTRVRRLMQQVQDLRLQLTNDHES